MMIHNNEGGDWNGEGQHECPGERREGQRGMAAREGGAWDFAKG